MWYSEIAGCGEKNDTPSFAIHINFWSETIRIKRKIPYFDIGVKISKFKSIDTMVFNCPFIVEKTDIEDLFPKLKDEHNANSIFNDEGKVSNTSKYSTYEYVNKKYEKEKFFLIPLDDKLFSLEGDDKNTSIKIDVSQYCKNINKHGEEDKDIQDAYIRFRIKSPQLKENIYFDSEPIDRSFNSAFSGTRFIDFKINEKRNIDGRIIDELEEKQFRFAKIDKIHFLVIEPASYEINAFTDSKMTCRELEKDIWNDYFGERIDDSKGRILIYHWVLFEENICLVSVKYSKMNKTSLLGYTLIALALGVCGSSIPSYIDNLFLEFEIMDLVVLFTQICISILLFGVGIKIGKSKK